jgi:hypothetical protein
MRKYFYYFTVICMVTFFPLTNLSAQSFVGKNRVFKLSMEELMALVPDAFEEGGPQNVAEKIFNLAPAKILEKLQVGGFSPMVTVSTFYISGNKFRIDTDTPEDGKTTIITEPEKDRICMIEWSMQQYVRMSIKTMNQKHTLTKEMMDSRYKNLPPEAREALKQYMGEQDPGEPGKLESTGRSETFNNIQCKEYRLDVGNIKTQLWVSTQYPEIRKTLESFMKNMPAGPDEKNDPDRIVMEQIPGAWPVITKELKFNMMHGQADLTVEEMISVKQETVSSDTYEIPDNLTEKSMQEIMDTPMIPK